MSGTRIAILAAVLGAGILLSGCGEREISPAASREICRLNAAAQLEVFTTKNPAATPSQIEKQKRNSAAAAKRCIDAFAAHDIPHRQRKLRFKKAQIILKKCRGAHGRELLACTGPLDEMLKLAK